jgi:peptide/nickel transport system substrate-binding protein
MGVVDMRSLAILCTTVAAAAVLCACTNGGPSASTGSGGGTAFIPGTLRIADIEEPDGLNPFISTVATSLDMSMLWGEYFFNVDDKDQYVPEVALAVPSLANGGISADGLTITYHLRHGIKWQDGAPLTAQDVIFTWHAIMSDRNNVQTRTGYDKIQDITAPDDYTVVVHMKQKYAPIIAYFMGLEGGGPILPAHVLAKYPNINSVPFNTKPIGSGPFEVVDWVHGDHITLAANPNYWRGAPKLHQIIYKWISSNTTIMTQLQTGEVDAWFRADPSLYPQLSDMPGHTTTVTAYSIFGHLDFNLRDPMVQDISIRRAVAYGIDRPLIIHDATHDVYQISDSDQPPFSWAYDRDLPRFSRDVPKAIALLEADGWKVGPDGIRVKDGKRLELQLSYVSGQVVAPAIGNIMTQELKDVGIALTQKTYPVSTYFAAYGNGGILNTGKYQLAYFAWINGVDPDDSSLYLSTQMPNLPSGGQNSIFWNDPTVDRLENVALTTFDIEKRKQAYFGIQREISDQVPTIILFAERRVDTYSDHFKHFIPSPAETANWNSWQWSME